MGMSSIFSGYSIAVSGMMANKDALTVSSHNISNVNTAGYSRQRTVMAEVKGACGLGAGTTLEEITRARDQYLDRNYRRENAGLGYWTTKSANLTDIQEMLNELQSDDGTSDSGLQQVITDYFDSWDDLATDAGSMESRNAVLAAAKAMLDMVAQITGQLSQLRRDCITKVEDAVDELQDTARKIATLNLQIKQLEARDVEADDLRDQRDQLIDEISSLTNL
ncbi:MAG TPA: flagellar hook-associated protein FlgK, partial [Firmicutes bacterium]|nr:flagellar hook-associated protein FlgK [Bacillota bacterium]